MFPEKKWEFTRATIEHAPEDPGVIVLWDGEEPIYIGHARTGIRAGLLMHLEGQHGSCSSKASHYSWEIAAWPTVRESGLLAEFVHKYGSTPRCHRKTG